MTADNMVRYKVSPLTEIRHSLDLFSEIMATYRVSVGGLAPSNPQWSQPDLSKNKTKIKHHFVKITSLFSKNKTHFSRTNTHIFLLFLHKIPFTYTVSIPLIKVYNF